MYYNIKQVKDDGSSVLMLFKPVRIWDAVDLMVQLQRAYPLCLFGYVPARKGDEYGQNNSDVFVSGRR